MDAKQRFDSLDDSAIDREIQAALDVNLSPEFLAHVRMRVADKRPARPLLTAGVLGSLAVALTVVVAALVLVRQEAAPTTPKAAGGRPPSPSGEIVRREPVGAPAVSVTRRPRGSSGVAKSVRQPPVIVPVEQIEAFRRLAEAINTGAAFAGEIELPKPDPASEGEDTQLIFANLRRPIERLAAVKIEPLEIEPISQ